MDWGVQEKLKQKMGELKQKGDAAFVQSSGDDLTMWAWMDSKVVMCISNVHQPCLVTTLCHTKGRAVPWSDPCPLPMHKYNMWMGAINDLDRLMSFHSTKLC
eukprot:345604-Rhodomonas_salina.2